MGAAVGAAALERLEGKAWELQLQNGRCGSCNSRRVGVGAGCIQ